MLREADISTVYVEALKAYEIFRHGSLYEQGLL
jgi:hypothetical protein